MIVWAYTFTLLARDLLDYITLISMVFAELERIPKKSLRRTDVCPICSNPFLDGKQIV